jgi:hypothetical protein
MMASSAMSVGSEAHTRYCRTNAGDPICVKRQMHTNTVSRMIEVPPLMGTFGHTRYCRDATYGDSICMNNSDY